MCIEATKQSETPADFRWLFRVIDKYHASNDTPGGMQILLESAMFGYLPRRAFAILSNLDLLGCSVSFSREI